MQFQESFGGDHEHLSKIFHSLMPFKVMEILLVSSFYDAFVIEEEGLISELIIGEYRHLLLSSPPRLYRANSWFTALSQLKEKKYDLVITMSKNIGMDPYEFGKEIKKLHPDLPVILLATESSDIRLIDQKSDKRGIDKAFYWMGDSTLFLAIIKYAEDRINARADTTNGNVRVIVMIEDSIRYYSNLLPIFYTEIVRQTQRIISEDLNEMQRLVTRKARPKILLAETFEEGMKLFREYKDNVLGIITDVRFPREGKMDPDGGFEFSRMIREESPFTPILMQSSELAYREKAEAEGIHFLHKNSPNLLQDFEHFLLNHLGFGDFVFVKPIGDPNHTKESGKSANSIHVETIEIARATNAKEFVRMLQEVPIESILFHAERNHFSNWLFARCEFALAKKLQPKKVTDFDNLAEIRGYLLNVFHESRFDKQRAVITDFSQQNFEFDSSFTRLTGDSLGGKGRGIAFMRSLLSRSHLAGKYRGIHITIPSTVVIGTLEFDRFIAENKILKAFEGGIPDDHKIAQIFLKSKINPELKDKLSRILDHFVTPLAIRSSGLLEDSHDFPFAGVYSTYMLPNNHENKHTRLKQLIQAIKLVYASMFYKEARSYLESISSKIEEEKMAVIIQNLVGRDYGDRFYPTFSGVIQSTNFYPVSHQAPEDGIASVAVGLGKTVVGGERVLRFSPRHPDIIPEFSSTELTLTNSQAKLWVLDTSKKDFKLFEDEEATLKRLDITDIREDRSLDLLASTYDMNDQIIRDGLSASGPPIITFSGILKYNAFPLSSLLLDLMGIGKQGMGCPVELEFAVQIDPDKKEPPTFAILQIRPLLPSYELCEIPLAEVDNMDNVLISSDKALGNGIKDSIQDIVYIPPERFDPSKTVEIAEEVGTLNATLQDSSSPYLLIGPGRWGTLDRWLGVPVKWSQISGAQVIVETALEDFNIEPSQGTHFFQNMVSRGIGYIYVAYDSKKSMIDWSWISNQPIEKELEFVRHVHLPESVTVSIDGRCGRAMVTRPELQ